jgi:hypothetical protein
VVSRLPRCQETARASVPLACKKQCNEGSGRLLNRMQYPRDVVVPEERSAAAGRIGCGARPRLVGPLRPCGGGGHWLIRDGICSSVIVDSWPVGWGWRIPYIIGMLVGPADVDSQAMIATGPVKWRSLWTVRSDGNLAVFQMSTARLRTHRAGSPARGGRGRRLLPV